MPSIVRPQIAMLIAIALAPLPAFARDKMKIAAPHPTIVTSTIPVIAQRLGLFEKQDVDVEILWTSGGADAQQSTVNGSVDMAVQTGIAGILSAMQQGAPIAIVAAEATGAPDVLWYVRADKPWKSLADFKSGEAVGFSRPGSSSDFTLRTLIQHFGSKAKPVPSGSPPETLTQVMTGQIEAGWIVPPLPKEFKEGKVRVIARGNDAPQLKALTIRVHAANANFLAAHKPAVKGFLKAWHDAIEALYSDPKALAIAAEMVKITPEQVTEIVRDYIPREFTVMNKIGDLDQAIKQAIDNKQMRGPLTDAQKDGIHKLVAELNVP